MHAGFRGRDFVERASGHRALVRGLEEVGGSACAVWIELLTGNRQGTLQLWVFGVSEKLWASVAAKNMA